MAKLIWFALVRLTLGGSEKGSGSAAILNQVSGQTRNQQKNVISETAAIEQTMIAQTNDVVDGASATMAKAEVVMGKATKELDTENKKITKKLLDTEREATQSTDQINLAGSEMVDMAEEGEGDMTDEVAASISASEAQTADVEAQATEGAETLFAAGEEVMQETAGEYSEFEGDISDGSKEEEETIKSNTEIIEDLAATQEDDLDEVADVAKGTLKLSKNTDTQIGKGLQSASNAVKKLSGDIETGKADGVKSIKNANRIFEETVKKDSAEVQDEFEGELKEEGKATHQLIGGLNKQSSDLASDADNGIKNVAASAAKVYSTTANDQETFEENLEKAVETADESEEDGEQTGEDLQTKIANTDKLINKDLRAQVKALNYDSQTLQENINQNIEVGQTEADDLAEKVEEGVEAKSDRDTDNVQRSIVDGTTNVKKAVDRVDEETETTIQEVDDIRQEAKSAGAKTAQIKTAVERRKDEIASDIAEVQDKTVEQGKKLSEFANDEIDASKSGLKQVLSDAKLKASAELEQFNAETASYITASTGQSQLEVDDADRQMTLQNRKAEDNINQLLDVAKVLQTRKLGLDDELPRVRDQVRGNFNEVDSAVKDVEKHIAEEKDTVLTEIGTRRAAQDAATEGELEDVSGIVKGQLGDANAKTTKEIAELLKETQEMKDSSEQGYTESDSEVQKLQFLITQAENLAKKIGSTSDETTQSLRAKINALEAMVSQTGKAESRKTQEAAQELKNYIKELVAQFATDSLDSTSTVMTDVDNKMKTFVKSTMNTIEGERQETDQFVQSSQSSIGLTEQDVDNLKKVLDKNAIAAQLKESGLLQKIAAYSTQEEQLRASAEAQVASRTEDIQQRTKTLETTVNQQLKEAAAQAEENLRTSQSHTTKSFQAEQAREANENDNVKSYVANFEGSMDMTTQRIGGMVAKTAKTENGFEAVTSAAGKAMQGDVSKLANDITMGDDHVGQEIQNEEKAVAGDMGGSLTVLEGTAGKLKSISNSAEAEVKQMEQQVNDQLAYQKQLGNAKSDELEKALAQINSGAVDLVAEFAEDTSGSKNQLENTEARLDQAISSSMEQMGSFKTRLAEISKMRELDATKMHGETSQMKQDFTETLGQAVNVIKEMKVDTDSSYAQMEQDQKDFDRMIVNASMMTSSHDDGIINNMTDKLYKLNSGHESLMGWWKSFKHITKAWRYHVDQHLADMRDSIGGDEDQIEQGRMASENALQSGLMNMQKGVERDVLKASQKETGAVGNLVHTVQGEMGALSTASQHSDEHNSAAFRQASLSIKNAAGESQGDMNDIADSSKKLQAMGNDLSTALTATSQAVDGELMFPKEEMKENGKAQMAAKNMQKLEEQITQVSQVASSFAQMGGKGHQGAAKEASAIRNFNDQLRKENKELAGEDDMLENRLDTITKKLESMGISVD